MKRNEKGQFITELKKDFRIRVTKDEKNMIAQHRKKEEFIIELIEDLKKEGDFSFRNRNISMINKGITQIAYEPKSFEKETYGTEDITKTTWFNSEKPFSQYNFGKGWQDQSKDFMSESELKDYLMNCHLADLKELNWE